MKMEPIPAPLKDLIKTLPKEKQKELLIAIFHRSIPNSSLIKEITGEKPEQSVEEILDENGITSVKKRR